MSFNMNPVTKSSNPMLIIMVGVPGSGKSTVANNLSNAFGFKVFSSDMYRKKLLGDESDQSNNAAVFEALYADMFDTLLNKGDKVIFDATNISIKDRKRVLSRLEKSSITKIAYIMNTDYETCVLNDRNRDRCVGELVIRKFIERYQCPQKFEGFDHIILHNNINDIFNWYDEAQANNVFSDMLQFKQYNPHHKFSVGLHCLKLKEQCSDIVMQEAAYYHDIGKLYTQHFDDNQVAHYYNHDNVGAYFLTCNPQLFRLMDWKNVLEAIFFVNYHMRAHRDFTGVKAERKYRALFGNERFNKLMQFAEYDRIASGTYKKET